MKLEELKAIVDAASPGPWPPWYVTTSAQESPDGSRYPLIHGAAPPHEIKDGFADQRQALRSASQDARFIVAARDAMPKLLAVAEAAQELFGQYAGQDLGLDWSCHQRIADALAALEAPNEPG